MWNPLDIYFQVNMSHSIYTWYPISSTYLYPKMLFVHQSIRFWKHNLNRWRSCLFLTLLPTFLAHEHFYTNSLNSYYLMLRFLWHQFHLSILFYLVCYSWNFCFLLSRHHPYFLSIYCKNKNLKILFKKKYI